MANITDPVTGDAAKVTAAGSLVISPGDDGLPTYFVPIYHPRLTTAISLGSALWGIRAPSGRTLVIQAGFIKIQLDTATTGEVGVELVRFTGADPAGGTTWTPAKKSTIAPDAVTTVVRSASAISALTTTGMTIDPATTVFLKLTIPFIAGSQAYTDFAPWVGSELAPGEGLLVVTRPAAAPIGFTTSGWLEFSEKA
jgi:hypothetical protein